MRFFLFLIIILSFSEAVALAKRPPQFVVFSFDNCTELERWREVTDFLNQMHNNGENIHFTFFISGTNFLRDAKKTLYQGPAHAAGSAEIPFAGTKNDMLQRIQLMNALYRSGNEFGSHAIGHFDSSHWTQAMWEQEFKNYDELMTHIAKNNNLPDTTKLAYTPGDVVGFRAPYLAENTALTTVLKENHFRYNASGIGEPNQWPKKINGIWRFNLAKLKVVGTGRETLSMDYNFMVAKANQQQMSATYWKYFLDNYKGSRAPIIIGHHFTNFQNGIYNQVLFAFAKKVCSLPEVRCVTFKELADFMDQKQQ